MTVHIKKKETATKIISVRVDVGKLEPLGSVGGNVKDATTLKPLIKT